MANEFRRDIQSFALALNRAVEGSASRQFLRILGDEMVDIIVTRTRRGFGVRTTDGNRKRLKPLAKSTIKARKRSKILSRRLTSPSKSNLTESGQMLDSIKSRVRGKTLLIKPTGSRRGGGTNQKVANHVSDDRPFLTLSRAEFNEIVDIYEDGLDASLKKSLSRLRR